MPDRAVDCSRHSCPKYFTFDAVLQNADDVEITTGIGKCDGSSKRMFDVDVNMAGAPRVLRQGQDSTGGAHYQRCAPHQFVE